MGGGTTEVTQAAFTPGELNGHRAVAEHWAQNIHLWSSLRRKDRRQAHINYVEAFPPKLIVKLLNHIQVLQVKAEGYERAYSATEAARFALEEEAAELKKQLAAVPTPSDDEVRKYIISKLNAQERLV